MSADSQIMGVIALVVFIALAVWVVTRARKGYQAIRQVMDLASNSSADAAANASNSVNVHVGHAMGSSQGDTAMHGYSEELERRLAASERAIREELAFETMGLQGRALPASEFAAYDSASVSADDVRNALFERPPGERFSASQRKRLSSLGPFGHREESVTTHEVHRDSGGGADHYDDRGADHYDDRGPDDYDHGGPGAFDYFDPEWRARNLQRDTVRQRESAAGGWDGGRKLDAGLDSGPFGDEVNRR